MERGIKAFKLEIGSDIANRNWKELLPLLVFAITDGCMAKSAT